MEHDVKEGQVWRRDGILYTIEEVVEEDMGVFTCWAFKDNDIEDDCLIEINTFYVEKCGLGKWEIVESHNAL